MSKKLSVNAAKATASAMSSSIAGIVADMRTPTPSAEDRCAIQTRCKALFTQWNALQESDAVTNEEVGTFDVMIELIDLFENYVNLMPLTPTPYCAMH